MNPLWCARFLRKAQAKYDVLYSIVLEQLRSYAAKALENESEVVSRLALQSRGDYDSERALIEKSIADDTSRLAAIEKLIAKLYADMVADRISAENFNAILAKSQAKRLEKKTAKISSF